MALVARRGPAPRVYHIWVGSRDLCLLFPSPFVALTDGSTFPASLVYSDSFPGSTDFHLRFKPYCRFWLYSTNRKNSSIRILLLFNMQAHSRLGHKFIPNKMHDVGLGHHHRSRLLVRIPNTHPLIIDTPSSNNTPIIPYLAVRGPPNEQGTMTPIILVGICLAGATCVILAISLVIRQQRKKASARTARTMERGVEAAKQSNEYQVQWRRSMSFNASHDTHVVNAVYGEKSRSSFESSDYHALSSNQIKVVNRAVITNSVISPVPKAALTSRMHPNLKAIDIQRANNPHAATRDYSSLVAPLPPAMFPTTPSSINTFYGPAIVRAHAEQNLPHSSAMRALAVAAGIATTPTSPTFEIHQQADKGEVELPIRFSPLRESTFGDGMKLGQHLGLRTSRENEREGVMSVQSANPQDHISPISQDGSSIRNVPSRPGTAGTFGQPLGSGFSFGSRVPYRTHRHAASSLSMADVKSVRISYASGQSSPGLAASFARSHSPHGSFSHSHGRTDSVASGTSNVITRKVQTVFPPLLPDELVLAVGDKVTLLETFDDEWCVVGRDRFGEVEVGAVPAYVFTKLRTGEKMERPMRSTSLGVKVEMSNAPGAAWSSRDEVISWSNF
ncbi:unnamed protein product [Rhizoctonia solani]|uniref:SH3 domain-containing protein n=2 Tax=Rhizoctonia solani TaxID=456999 RepID=A0A8H7LHA5_9AGAM|nr:hypothetical protein RHS04_07579 [Rhizoctonia solani]CAE6361644.1 unnamed protein product [Rhizoctonia solani]